MCNPKLPWEMLSYNYYLPSTQPTFNIRFKTKNKTTTKPYNVIFAKNTNDRKWRMYIV